MYRLYAEGFLGFFAGVRFAFGLADALGEVVPWESAARITRPISSSVNDTENRLSYQQRLIGLQLP